MPDKGVNGTYLRNKNQENKVIKPSKNIFEFLRGELSGWQDIGNILKIEDDVYKNLKQATQVKGMTGNIGGIVDSFIMY